MTPRPISELEAYWEGLRNGRLVPLRSEIDPRGMSGALEHAFVAERIAPGMARLRVSGMHLADLMGMEMRGMPLSSLFEPEGRGALAETLEAVFAEPAAAKLDLVSPSSFGRSSLKADMILLPLRSDTGAVERLLGCIVADGAIGRQPRRFAVERRALKTLIGYGQTSERATFSPDRNLEFAENRADFSPAPRLRVVRADD